MDLFSGPFLLVNLLFREKPAFIHPMMYLAVR
jgi:hypothetical protein